jgi:hypothetical protein
MTPARPKPSAIGVPQRAIVWLLVGLVMTLGMLAVTPDLHARLHASTDDHHHHHATPSARDDSDCVVTLFHGGVTPPLDLPTLEAPVFARICSLPPARDARFIPAPRQMLRPVRGPPVIG